MVLKLWNLRNLTGDQWLDPGTFRIMFQLNNRDYDAASSIFLQPLSWNPAVFFRRCRIIAGGAVIEDIDNFYRLPLMLHFLKPEEEQLGIASEGFCIFGARYGPQAADPRKNYRLDGHERSGIVAGRKVMFKPLVGISSKIN